jgi:hypothetical protein
MQRIIHRQVTAIQITSIEVLWDEDRHPFPYEIVDAAIVAPALPEPKPRKKSKKAKSGIEKKTRTRNKKPAPPSSATAGATITAIPNEPIVSPTEIVLKNRSNHRVQVSAHLHLSRLRHFAADHRQGRKRTSDPFGGEEVDLLQRGS